MRLRAMLMLLLMLPLLERYMLLRWIAALSVTGCRVTALRRYAAALLRAAVTLMALLWLILMSYNKRLY